MLSVATDDSHIWHPGSSLGGLLQTLKPSVRFECLGELDHTRHVLAAIGQVAALEAAIELGVGMSSVAIDKFQIWQLERT